MRAVAIVFYFSRGCCVRKRICFISSYLCYLHMDPFDLGLAKMLILGFLLEWRGQYIVVIACRFCILNFGYFFDKFRNVSFLWDLCLIGA